MYSVSTRTATFLPANFCFIGFTGSPCGYKFKFCKDTIYYLMSRGLNELEAKSLIVLGFAEPISSLFPVEYAVEMNRLINLELEGTIG